MKLVTVKMPEIYVQGIEELVAAGRYSSRSEVIRIAVRELLKRELWGTGYTGIPVPLSRERGEEKAYPGIVSKSVLKGVGLAGMEAVEANTEIDVEA